MTTDITELAQSEINDALAQLKQISEYPTPSTQYARVLRKYILALVEALASEKRICATWRKTAEANSEKLEKAQQQMTESENRVRKQNRHICELFDDNTALRQRIAGLEARTVKLPDLRQIVSGDRYVWSDGVYNYSQDVKVALAAAGIKVEAE